MTANITRITPADAKTAAHNGALLVSTYDTGAGFEPNALDGVIPFSALKEREADLDQNSQLIFY